MPDIAHNFNILLQGLRQTAAIYGRNVDDVRVLAVSKTQNAEAVRTAYGAGMRSFGENYLQEALEKIEKLADLDIEWHFIGPIQSNKTRPIAEHFDWVHTVDRLKIAQRLNDQRPNHLPPLNVCLQVNIDDEDSKSGATVAEIPDLALAVAKLPALRLRGLMTIPQPSDGTDNQRKPFFRLRQLLDTLRTLAPELAALDTLSMGMSGDMDAAIAEGATIVRVGTAIFGLRRPRADN